MSEALGKTDGPVAVHASHWERLLERTFLPGRVRGDLNGRIDRLFRLQRLLVAELSLAPQTIEHTASHLRAFSAEGRASVVAHVVLDGAGCIEQNGVTLPFRQGDVTFRSFATPSCVAFSAPTKIFSIQLPASAVGLPHPSAYGTTGVMPKVVGGTSLSAEAARRLLLGLASDGVSAAERLCALTAVPWLIAGAYYSDGATAGSRLAVNVSRWQSVLSYIDSHLFDSEALTPAACAGSLGISARYLHKLFALRGLRFSRVVLERRLDAARALLEDPAYRVHSVASIAYQCGFASAAHFSRRFSGRFRISPRQCRDGGAAEAGDAVPGR